MLAAIQASEDRTLELILLALRSVRKNDRQSARFREYVENVVRQALEVVKNPESISEKTLPEAIRLAVELQAYADLDQKIDQIMKDNKINTEAVEEIISRAEYQIAI